LRASYIKETSYERDSSHVLIAVIALAGVVAHVAPASEHAEGAAAPIFGIKIPAGS
jgi:hypothetical protein